MAGTPGAVIGLLIGDQSNIAPAVALTDATTTGKGCTTNFIGFGLGLSSAETIQDFDGTDDVVTNAIAGGQDYEPTYTNGVLTWVDTTP